MIAKDHKKRSSFAAVCSYVFRKEGARFIAGSFGTDDRKEISRQATMMLRIKPNLKNAVVHKTLSIRDDESLTDDQWSEIANRYAKEMGFKNAGWTAVLHTDTQNPHIHFIAVRIDMQKRMTISDSNDYKRSARAVQAIERDYSLTAEATTPTQAAKTGRRAAKSAALQQFKRTSEVPVSMQLQLLIDKAAEDAPALSTLIDRLAEVGVITLPAIAKTERISGVTFELDGFSYKGSSLGSVYSYSGLQKRGITYEPNRDSEAVRRATDAAKTTVERRDNRADFAPVERARNDAEAAARATFDAYNRTRERLREAREVIDRAERRSIETRSILTVEAASRGRFESISDTSSESVRAAKDTTRTASEAIRTAESNAEIAGFSHRADAQSIAFKRKLMRSARADRPQIRRGSDNNFKPM